MGGMSYNETTMKLLRSNHHNMRIIHWIVFVIALWIILVPFIGDDILKLVLGESVFAQVNIVDLLKWDDLFLGLGICILSLIAATLEQLSKKHPGLKAMHWMQLVLGIWITVAPFAITFDLESFAWSHFVSGVLIATFALLQIRYEE